jgi:hypothetical protein
MTNPATKKTTRTTEQRAAAMVATARKMAKAEMGTSSGLLAQEVRKAIVCKALVSVFAAQDESITADIGPVFHKACEMIAGSEE